ncbi:hypothetical protein BN1221_04152c [Brenneria goodwinii]|uniref:Uncharacterized protein n=1 Tax=Brenneria goodwinii TaxID=1109412 RepID=A0A0G4K0F2_9GAMM|nr:hypothetical protein BN1221_04152c [Brenneria goodwinii]
MCRERLHKSAWKKRYRAVINAKEKRQNCCCLANPSNKNKFCH